MSGNPYGLLRVSLASGITPDTWVTSDQHWSHRNIRVYQGRPDNHFAIMRERWIASVQPEDTVLHLGDLVCFGDMEEHGDYLAGLPGRKYLLRGNHDKPKDQWYIKNGFTPLGREPLRWHDEAGDRMVCFSHEPERTSFRWDINIHGHIHNNPYWSGVPMLDYRNVCVEVTDYAPVRIGAVLDGTAGRRRLEAEA